MLLGDMGEEIGSGEFLQPDDAPIRRERLVVSCVVSEGVCHVLGALYKGVLNHMSFDVRRTHGGEGVGGEQELVWMEWERPGCVDGIVSAAAAYKEYEITQLAMAEVDRQGRQGSGWMVAVVHASKPGTGASFIWSLGFPTRVLGAHVCARKCGENVVGVASTLPFKPFIGLVSLLCRDCAERQ